MIASALRPNVKGSYRSKDLHLREATSWPGVYSLKQGPDPASIDRDRAAGDVARALRYQKRSERRELTRLADTAHWNFFLPFGEGVLHRRAGSRSGSAGKLLEAICSCVAGHDVVDRHVERRDFIGQRPREPGDGRAQTVREHEAVDGLLHRDRSHVENPAPPPLLHSWQQGARKTDGAGQKKPRSSFPHFRCQTLERSTRWASRVGDEDVHFAEFVERGFRDPIDPRLFRHIRRDFDDGNARALANRIRRLAQSVLAARAHDEIRAFSGKLFGDRAAEPFAAG